MESYYWDSFWILKGLLVSHMNQTAQGILNNAKWLVETYGFIPNGNRIYYLNRSQPPFFTWMLLDLVAYFLQQGSLSDRQVEVFLLDILPSLHREYAFWMLHKSIEVGNMTR